MMVVTAVVVCLLLEAAIGYGLWRQLVRLRSQQAAVAKARQRLSEARSVIRAREELEANRQRVETTVDWTTASVESIHRSISDLSFGLWGDDNCVARHIHDRTTDQVYDTIREVNRGVGSLLSSLLDQDKSERRK